MTEQFTAVCVEDDEDARTLLAHAVNGLGGVLIETARADDGITAIEEHKPDLVLLDLALPGRSGWAVVGRMRSDDTLQEIPIIIVSIKDQAEEEYLGQHVDWVQGYVTKPFALSELEDKIREVLGF